MTNWIVIENPRTPRANYAGKGDTTMSEPNWEMLARVRDRIAEVGDEHCDMGYWCEGGSVTATGSPACGATACIAGWTLALEHGVFTFDVADQEHEEVAQAACRALGLRVIADPRLFHAEEWPEDYQETARAEGDAKGMLAILDDILDRKIDPNTLQAI